MAGLGPVLFEKSKRSKSLNIFVRPFKGVRVAIPYSVSFEEAQRMAESKAPWIKKHLSRMKKFEEKHEHVLLNKTPIDTIYAKNKLTERVKELAEEYGFLYNKITVRRQRTRWGSCSHRNNISLNAKLSLLPEELIDYVILHELMHTRVKSHGVRFWQTLDKVIPGAKKIDSKLRQYHLELI